MKEERSFLCVSCPIGCSLSVQVEDGAFSSVSGNQCAMGDRYARNELVDPKRLYTSTVVVEGAKIPVCPVRSVDAVPIGSILDVSKALAQVVIKAPVAFGQVVLRDVCGTGVDIVTTRELI